MEDIHPSQTAGTGRAIKKQNEAPGDRVDRRIECGQCGFRFDPDRDTEGDSGSDESVGGITPQTVTIAISNDQDNLPVHLRGMDTFSATSRDVIDPVVSSGCPFCGTWNPRAQFRNDKAFYSGKDIRNQ